MYITTQEIQEIPNIGDIIDVHTTLTRIYILRNSHHVEVWNFSPTLLQTLELTKKGKRLLHVYADSHTLMIAFEDGTMELRQIGEDYRLLRVTSDKDPGGPGSKKIMQIGASPDFVLAQSYENGLLIYSKPSLLFYKWIMLGGHCEISAFTIKYHQLYVLVERPEHEIHMLDFDKHRIFEQEVKAYTYKDIEFDGLYLYAATSSSVFIYLQEEANRPMKQKQVGQLNFSDRIFHLLRFNDAIFVVFQEYMCRIRVVIDDIDSPNISLGKKIAIPSTNLTKKLKYDFFSSQPHETYSNNRKICYHGEKDLLISEIKG